MKHKNGITVLVFALFIGSLSLFCWFGPQKAYSEGERRMLAEKPELTLSTLATGEFMDNFETYTADQFPGREILRKIKALFATYVFNQKDNNGLFAAEGHISKIEYPVHPEMVDHAEERFDYIYNQYLKDKDVKLYLSIIPDKNYFLAEENGYLSMDYDAFIEDFRGRMEYMDYIDVLPLLSLDDYYRTDSHWKQEAICDVAIRLAERMGTDAKAEYSVNTLDVPFKGVYLGQSALPYPPDTISYLTNDVLSGCTVTYYDTGKPVTGEMYNMEKAAGKDPYEMFLSGTSPLIQIENPQGDKSNELVVFRDSFGSSLAPLLVPGYSKVTVVDIRYMQSSFLGNFIEFSNQDVLFLYSTTLLNNSMAMR